MTASSFSRYEPVPASHPDHLWVAAALRGIDAPSPASASVLELACGDGSNLIPLAYHRPGARFVGLEGSNAIDAAVASVTELGIDNLTFVRGSLDAIRARGERYDYVIIHGVLSTVSDAAREDVLALVRDVLSERGVVYVDHLGRAGRWVELRLRELVRGAVGPLPTVQERVRAIRSILDALDSEEPPAHDPHAVSARLAVSFARSLGDAALVSHFLAPYRRTLAPSELASLAARHDMSVVGAGWEPSLERLAEERVRRSLATVAGACTDDLVELVTGRRTHAALLVRTAALSDGGAPLESIGHGRLAGKLETRLDDVLLDPGIETAFSTHSGSLVRTKDPFNKALLVELRDAWPAGVSFGELVQRASGVLADAPSHPPAPTLGDVARQATELLGLHQLDALRWRSAEVTPAQGASERPQVSPLTAWQANRSNLLTDPDHRLVVVDELTRRVVMLLDGTRDVAALLSEVEAWHDAGELVRTDEKKEADDDGVTSLVRDLLDRLTKAELLAS